MGQENWPLPTLRAGRHLGTFFCDLPRISHGPSWAPDVWVVMTLVVGANLPISCYSFWLYFREIQIWECSEALSLWCQNSWCKLRTAVKQPDVLGLNAKHFYNGQNPDSPLRFCSRYTCVHYLARAGEKWKPQTAWAWLESPEVWKFCGSCLWWSVISQMDNICVVSSSCTGQEILWQREAVRPRAPSIKWEDTRACFSAGKHRLHPAPDPICGGGRQGGNGLKRAYFSDPTLGIQTSWLSIQQALRAFQDVSRWQDGKPAKPRLEVLMAGPLVWRILLHIWKSSQEKMLLAGL